MSFNTKQQKLLRFNTSFSNTVINDSNKHKTVDYSKFAIVKETVYSSVRPYHFLQIGRILKRLFKNPKIIVDLCSHIGCSTINLAHIFPMSKLVGVELKKTIFKVLENNIKEFEYQNRITAVNENCIPFLKKMLANKIKPDFISMDPPWGGPGYSNIKKLMLTLNNTAGRSLPIYEIINNIFERDLTSFVTFKAPNNFDMDLFKDNVNGTIKIYPIYNKPVDTVRPLNIRDDKKPINKSKKTSSKKKTSTGKTLNDRKTVYNYVVIKKLSF
jgi:16S rRNA G966 N2-methylase RsmD